MNINKADATLPEIIRDLLSYDEARHRRVLDQYFTENAKLTHPLLSIEGTHNIRKVFRVWTSLNGQEPTIKDTVFDGTTAVVHTMQHLRPRIMPFLHLEVPSVTTLRFRETEGGLYLVYKQEDTWTLEGLIQSVPLVNWWYEKVVRVVMGELVTRAGSFIYTANQATAQLTVRAGEIGEKSREAITQGQAKAQSIIIPYQTKAQELISPYSSKAQEIITDGQTKVQDITGFAKAFVYNAQAKVRGVQPGTFTNGNIVAEVAH